MLEPNHAFIAVKTKMDEVYPDMVAYVMEIESGKVYCYVTNETRAEVIAAALNHYVEPTENN